MEEPALPTVVVFGGYGTFGRHVARELAGRGISVTVAGRDRNRAESFARQLGNNNRGIVADLFDGDSCQAAIGSARVAVNCAGPFGRFDTTLLDACLATGCHYVDIADDRHYVAAVRAAGPRFAERELTAAFGCSSLPGISGAAALAAREDVHSPIRHVRCALFIGNDNPKGTGAVTSAASQLGRSIQAPQGIIRPFLDREIVPLPAPFGPRGVRNFESPDYDLLPELLGTPSVVVKVGFELHLTNVLFGAFARTAPRVGRWLLPRLAAAGGLVRRWGCSGGAVLTELFLEDGSCRQVAVGGSRNGQRMAALPAVYVAERLARNQPCPRGAVTAYDILGGRGLLDLLAADGYEVTTVGPDGTWVPLTMNPSGPGNA